MKPIAFAGALLSAAALPCHAQIAIDSVAGSDITFEGLIQSDADWYDSDVADLDGGMDDGDDADYELRTDQLYLRGKGPSPFDWSAGLRRKGR